MWPQYRVLVPDLYRGKLGVDAEEASHLMTNLDWAGAVQDIGAAADMLAEDGNGSVGVVGFCMGGALSLASAALVDESARATLDMLVPQALTAAVVWLCVSLWECCSRLCCCFLRHPGLGLGGHVDPQQARSWTLWR
jgi:hypothetical protein